VSGSLCRRPEARRLGAGFGHTGETPTLTGPRCASVQGLVPRRSVSGNTVLWVRLPRPLAADADLPAPSCMCDPSRKTNRLTSGRFVC